MIPKKIHFIWIGSAAPRWLKNNIQRWRDLNPEYQIKIHGERSLGSEFKSLYKNVKDLCSKSDLLRLSILRRQGGWYFDIDFVPLRPMADLCEDFEMPGDIFLTKQWEPAADKKNVANGIIGIASDSPYWKSIDELVKQHSERPLERTSFGPLLTTRLVQECPSIQLAAVKDFYQIRFNPRGLAMEAYKRLLKDDFSEDICRSTFGPNRPYAFHLWMGGDYPRKLV